MGHLATFAIKPDTAYMEVPRCETCRFFVPPADDSVEGTCELFSSDGRPEMKPSRMAFAWSKAHPDPPSRFYVRQSFGCVQWEAERR
jgi:hypothetical protein